MSWIGYQADAALAEQNSLVLVVLVLAGFSLIKMESYHRQYEPWTLQSRLSSSPLVSYGHLKELRPHHETTIGCPQQGSFTMFENGSQKVSLIFGQVKIQNLFGH